MATDKLDEEGVGEVDELRDLGGHAVVDAGDIRPGLGAEGLFFQGAPGPQIAVAQRELAFADILDIPVKSVFSDAPEVVALVAGIRVSQGILLEVYLKR